MKKLVALFLLMAVCGMIGQSTTRNDELLYEAPRKPKSMVKVSHIGPNTIGITCLNGGDPAGFKPEKIGGFVNKTFIIVDCGK